MFFFRTLTFIFSYKNNFFSIDQKNKIYDWLDDFFDQKSDMGKICHETTYLYKHHIASLKALKKILNELISEKLISDIYSIYNPEINIDQKKLIEEFNRYDFPKDLSETLDKIETKISTAKDGFDYKNCMDLMRSFTERLFRSIAIDINHIKGKKVNVEDSKVIAKFFVSEGLLSETQANFLKSMRNFLSNSASHRLKSPPEECRLSKNILIEFSLFLIGRLKQLKLKT